MPMRPYATDIFPILKNILIILHFTPRDYSSSVSAPPIAIVCIINLT